MKKISALFLALCLLMSLLSGCGGSGSSAETQASAPSQNEAAESAPTASEAPSVEAPAPEAEASEILEEASEAESAVPKVTISYPIPGEDNRLSMVQCLRNHAAAVLGDGDFSNQYVYPELAKRTGVEIDFEMIAETAYTERLNLIIVSQDFPDIFGQGIGTYDNNPMKAIADDVVLDLAPLLAENAPDYNDLIVNREGFTDAVVNSDGSICKITSCNIGVQSQGMFIRGDWLDALGLEVPTTIDEMTEVLRAFHNAYNTPMTLLVNADLDDGLAAAFDHSNVGFTRQMLGFQQTAPDSGEVICAMASEGYFDHMTLLRQYYAEGLINGDFASISKENGNFESTYYTGQCGIWQEGCEIADSSYAENSNDPNWVALPMLTPTNGDKETHMSSFTEVMAGMASVYISTGCANPEMALQFLNYGFTPEGKDLVAFGIEGETYHKDEDGNVQYSELLTDYPDGIRAAEWLYLINSWMPTEQQMASVNMKYSPTAVEAYEMWTEAAKKSDSSMTLPMMLSLNTEENDVVSQYCGDLCTHFSEYTAKYIMGTIDEAGFRQAIADADKIGLQEVTAAYQSAYDRYLAEH